MIEMMRESREAAGWSQAKAAGVLGVTRPAYAQRESGRTAFSALDVLKLHAAGMIDDDTRDRAVAILLAD